MRFVKARAALDVWLVWIAAALRVDEAILEKIRLPKTRDMYLQAG